MTSSETKVCQNCQQSFVIDASDFAFYERIAVPPPTFCPECRNIRRFAWREDHTLYKDVCRLCNEETLSVQHPEAGFTVYCRDCWISDKWDPLDYGRDYDFGRPFFEQYRELVQVVPRPALTGINIVNSKYSHACNGIKNCYFAFWAYFTEDSQYTNAPLFSKYTFDSFLTDYSDHTYETMHCNKLYQTKFAYFADECLDSSFLYDCLGCVESFGCINLRKRKYCLWNEQFSKEEYKKQMEYWDLGSYSKLQEAKQKFRELYLKTPRRDAHITNAVNVSGDIIRDAKDCQNCFSILDGVQNCKHIFIGGLNLKDSYDLSAGGDTSALLYETLMTTRAQRVMFSSGSSDSIDTQYCDWAYNCQDCFGSISIQNKKYVILNKQYNRQEYEDLVKKIKIQMISNKEYGEFFPIHLSAYGYNESLAFKWYPKTKEEVQKLGWNWRDPVKRDYTITIQSKDLPDHIRDVNDDILNQIIGCEHQGQCNELCTSAFIINREELNFYRKMNVSLPRFCPNCRYHQRLSWRNGFRTFDRQCHKCQANIKTSFSPQQPEIVWCDRCYKQEFF